VRRVGQALAGPRGGKGISEGEKNEHKKCGLPLPDVEGATQTEGTHGGGRALSSAGTSFTSTSGNGGGFPRGWETESGGGEEGVKLKGTRGEERR
jgi:hypothetical protein